MTAWRNKGLVAMGEPAGKLTAMPVTLPPGWASRLAGWVAPYLWWRILQQSRISGEKLQGLVVTSPHYLELVKRAAPHTRTFYYCSDDYAQYANWGGDAILQKEAELARRVDHSFFVSCPLAERAVSDYGLNPKLVSISPNATDDSFFQLASGKPLSALFRDFPALRRPLVGVVGAINSRLDFELIEACCNLPSVGSVVMVGPVDSTCQHEGLLRLRQNGKCVFVGTQPHESLPMWMQALDVALIPYLDTSLNRSCSPMRLFDHLAAGKPVVATGGCPQVRLFESLVKVGQTTTECAEMVQNLLQREPEEESQREARRQAALEHTWASRSQRLFETMKRYF